MRGEGSKRVVGFAGVLLVVTLALWWHFHRLTIESAPNASNGPNGSSTPRSVGSTNSGVSGGQADEQLRNALAGLIRATDPTGKSQALAKLRQELTASPTNEVSTSIRQFLDSRTDTPTGEGFKIGGNGFLSEAPTLRTVLLDYLGRIDPAAAAEYARVILSTKDSPDEWAVALRNLALGDSGAGGRELLQNKMAEMLTYSPWQQNPSVGYLESFDVAVHLGGTNFIPTLTGLVRSLDNQAVAHAAYLTLDRLVIRDPAAVLEVLGADPDSMHGRELTRADYFARTDVRNPRQRENVEKYLLDPRIGSAELQQFAGVFPNANFMISQNLLTAAPTPDPSALTARDAESLRVVQQWLADPRFARLRPQLEKMKSRLDEFVRQAGHPAQN